MIFYLYRTKGRQNKRKNTSFNFVPQRTFDPVTLLPVQAIHPSPRKIVAKARQMRGLMDVEKSVGYCEGIDDIEFLKQEEQILEMKERHSEILFNVERYCILVFAVMCILFNIFYWPYLVYA